MLLFPVGPDLGPSYFMLHCDAVTLAVVCKHEAASYCQPRLSLLQSARCCSTSCLNEMKKCSNFLKLNESKSENNYNYTFWWQQSLSSHPSVLSNNRKAGPLDLVYNSQANGSGPFSWHQQVKRVGQRLPAASPLTWGLQP